MQVQLLSAKANVEVKAPVRQIVSNEPSLLVQICVGAADLELHTMFHALPPVKLLLPLNAMSSLVFINQLHTYQILISTTSSIKLLTVHNIP